MKLKKKHWVGLIVLGVEAVLAAGSARAENKFDYCLLCHGADANGNFGIRAPKISGVEPWYLSRQLENFAAGIRGVPGDDAAGHEMGPVGMRLKQEATLEAAVEYIGTLKSKPPAPTLTGDVAHGKQLYANCTSCHGAKGEGNQTLNAPALAGRSDWYLVVQLANYQKGVRGADERDIYGAQMRAIIATLPDEKAITDVVAYINTLK
ncbi:MAG TPA: c-type cytochrome [Steroidobacteraceae bacterium]|nr:c-type cytochrome [Steroidobacteraceae bacterium]